MDRLNALVIELYHLFHKIWIVLLLAKEWDQFKAFVDEFTVVVQCQMGDVVTGVRYRLMEWKDGASVAFLYDTIIKGGFARV